MYMIHIFFVFELICGHNASQIIFLTRLGKNAKKNHLLELQCIETERIPLRHKMCIALLMKYTLARTSLDIASRQHKYMC